MEVGDSDDESHNSDDLHTDVSDDESVDPVIIWVENPYRVKENKKISNESSYSVKNAQHSGKDESAVNIECSICLQQIKSSNLASVDGHSHTFCYACIKTLSERKTHVLVAELSII